MLYPELCAGLVTSTCQEVWIDGLKCDLRRLMFDKTSTIKDMLRRGSVFGPNNEPPKTMYGCFAVPGVLSRCCETLGVRLRVVVLPGVWISC